MNDHNYWAKHQAQQIAAMKMQGKIPAKRTGRKPLTDEEIDNIELPPNGCTMRELVRAIERAHGITE
jgi:hypothetical protein